MEDMEATVHYGLPTNISTHGLFSVYNSTPRRICGSRAEFYPDQWVVLITLPPILILGITGNIFSILVMTRKRFNHNPTATFLINLAIFDSIFILTNSQTNTWIRYVTCFDFQQSCTFVCKSSKYLIYVSKCVSAWLLVFVAVDRYTVVAYPFKAKVIFSKRNTMLMIIALVTLVMLIYSYIPILMTNGETYSVCTYGDHISLAVQTGFNIFDLVLYSFLPSLSLISLNTALCVKLNQRRKKQVGAGSFSTALVQADSLQFTLTLVTISMTYLICTLPLALVLVYNTFPNLPMIPVVVFNLFYTLTLVNSSVNFLLYCLSGPAFRHELRQMFRQSCTCARKNNVVGSKSVHTISRRQNQPSSESFEVKTG